MLDRDISAFIPLFRRVYCRLSRMNMRDPSSLPSCADIIEMLSLRNSWWCLWFCVEAQETAQLEEQLQGWGEVILAGDRVVRWEKPWFPGALMGGTTVLFLWVHFTVCCTAGSHTHTGAHSWHNTHFLPLSSDTSVTRQSVSYINKLLYTGSKSKSQMEESVKTAGL